MGNMKDLVHPAWRPVLLMVKDVEDRLPTSFRKMSSFEVVFSSSSFLP